MPAFKLDIKFKIYGIGNRKAKREHDSQMDGNGMMYFHLRCMAKINAVKHMKKQIILHSNSLMDNLAIPDTTPHTPRLSI